MPDYWTEENKICFKFGVICYKMGGEIPDNLVTDVIVFVATGFGYAQWYEAEHESLPMTNEIDGKIDFDKIMKEFFTMPIR